MKKGHFVIVIAMLVAACTTTTSAIDTQRADAFVRQSCPAFKTGVFKQDSARTYGTEQVTTFQNGSSFNCRCIAKAADQALSCQQVRRFVLGNIE
jgi:starvation-inducible outer membrane lipoprotein